MSRLVLENLVGPKYDKADLSAVIRAITGQLNSLSEGSLVARYQAQVSVPVSVSAAVGDIVWDSSPTVRGSVSPGVASNYVRLGWICTAGSPTAPTFVEMRLPIGT